eukprot:TRINITY_DN80082_c0_g1_i1.p1 TRINITY_DN80082_c0_g1~~TRINITY_DN80082_c0_g1_i1.p1  ORF type:complete len:300 (+),score=63.25 TRINITY_DN80082_c0_g1_i1:58-957(+)
MADSFDLGGYSTFCCCFATVSTSNVAVVENFGKFSEVWEPGLHCYNCCTTSIAGSVSTRVLELDIRDLETKTKDNVFVKMAIAVQYDIDPNKAQDAYYKLSNAARQISSFVEDVVRGVVPKLALDELFETKEEIAISVKESLNDIMSEFGYNIRKSLVTNIEPDTDVKAAMNEINASTRLRVAAKEKAEGQKIVRVKEAEAEAESKKLQGKGVAGQRKAIMSGLRESVKDFADDNSLNDVTAKDAMQLLITTQYLDTMKDIGSSSRTNTIFIPHSPAAVGDLSNQIRTGFIEANSSKRN